MVSAHRGPETRRIQLGTGTGRRAEKPGCVVGPSWPLAVTLSSVKRLRKSQATKAQARRYVRATARLAQGGRRRAIEGQGAARIQLVALAREAARNARAMASWLILKAIHVLRQALPADSRCRDPRHLGPGHPALVRLARSSPSASSSSSNSRFKTRSDTRPMRSKKPLALSMASRPGHRISPPAARTSKGLDITRYPGRRAKPGLFVLSSTTTSSPCRSPSTRAARRRGSGCPRRS